MLRCISFLKQSLFLLLLTFPLAALDDAPCALRLLSFPRCIVLRQGRTRGGRGSLLPRSFVFFSVRVPFSSLLSGDVVLFDSRCLSGRCPLFWTPLSRSSSLRVKEPAEKRALAENVTCLRRLRVPSAYNRGPFSFGIPLSVAFDALPVSSR